MLQKLIKFAVALIVIAVCGVLGALYHIIRQVGRIFKTRHILRVYDEPAHRRRINSGSKRVSPYAFEHIIPYGWYFLSLPRKTSNSGHLLRVSCQNPKLCLPSHSLLEKTLCP